MFQALLFLGLGCYFSRWPVRGIIVIWKKSIGRVTPLAVIRRALHLIISPNPDSSYMISIIYNSHRLCAQLSLWQELNRISVINLPWLIIGDFNCITSRDEQRGGMFAYYSHKAYFFHDIINSNNLFDLHVSGLKFTWYNNQFGPGRHWAKLDRCLVNNF